MPTKPRRLSDWLPSWGIWNHGKYLYDTPSVGQVSPNLYNPVVSGMMGAMGGYGFGKEMFGNPPLCAASGYATVNPGARKPITLLMDNPSILTGA